MKALRRQLGAAYPAIRTKMQTQDSSMLTRELGVLLYAREQALNTSIGLLAIEVVPACVADIRMDNVLSE